MIADNPRLLLQADLYDLASTPAPAMELGARSFATPTIAYPKWLSVRVLFAVCAITLLAQGVLVILAPQAMVAFNSMIALEFLFAAAGCFRYASRQNAE